MNGRKLKWLLCALLLAGLAQPGALWACATCFGKSDSPLAQGMNWGIFTLLGFTVFVLGSIGSFFVFLARRSADTVPDAAAGNDINSESKTGNDRPI